MNVGNAFIDFADVGDVGDVESRGDATAAEQCRGGINMDIA